MATPTPKIGDRVLVGSTGQVGTLRYLGATAFREGFWAGVELDSESGKNDGTVQGYRSGVTDDVLAVHIVVPTHLK